MGRDYFAGFGLCEGKILKSILRETGYEDIYWIELLHDSTW